MLVLVIPVFNFSKNLNKTLERLSAWKKAYTAQNLKIVFSDDGSTDQTLKILMAFQSNNSDWFEVIHSNVNKGKGAAIRAGFLSALKHNPEYIIFSDCDLHFGLKIIDDKMVPLLKKNHMVILDRSWNKSAAHIRLTRRILTAVFKRLVSILTGVNIADTQAGLKGFEVASCKHIFEKLKLDSFTFDVEILSIASFYRLNIAQIPVSFQEDYAFPESSTISAFKTSIAMFLDLIKINWNWKNGSYFIEALSKEIDNQTYKITI